MEEIVHQDASTKKRVFALLIDYFLLVVGNVIFYFILVSQVANALPLMKELSNSFYESYTTTNQIIEDSKLDTITSSNYIKMSVKTTLGEKYYLTTEYDLLASLNKSNDPIYYYLNEYKVNHLDEYQDDSFTLNNYLNDIKSSNYYDMTSDNYYLLKEEVASHIGDYLFNNNLVFKEEYDSFYEFTINNFSKASSDLRENNLTYLNSFNELNIKSNEIRCANFIEINISFVFSYVLIFILPFFINKKHKSLGAIAMKITPVSIKKPCKIQLFIKSITVFILTYSSIFFSLFLTSGTSYGQVLMLDLNGFYLVLLLLVFSLLVSLFSFILEFLPFSKSSLSDYFSGYKMKDDLLVEENESSR